MERPVESAAAVEIRNLSVAFGNFILMRIPHKLLGKRKPLSTLTTRPGGTLSISEMGLEQNPAC